MKSERAIRDQIVAIQRQMKRNTPGIAFSMMTQVINALEWVLDNGNDSSRTLADLARFEAGTRKQSQAAHDAPEGKQR